MYGRRRYGRRADPLQRVRIATLFERIAAKGFDVDGVEVRPFPLFKVLDGKDTADYVQRVEPSVQGGRKIARAFLDELFPTSPEEDASRL